QLSQSLRKSADGIETSSQSLSCDVFCGDLFIRCHSRCGAEGLEARDTAHLGRQRNARSGVAACERCRITKTHRRRLLLSDAGATRLQELSDIRPGKGTAWLFRETPQHRTASYF